MAGQPIECLGHAARAAALQEIEQGGFGDAGLTRSLDPVRVVKERYRHLKEVADLLKPARADGVRTLFVFLNLLEADADPFSELGLRKAAFEAARPDTATQLHVPGRHPLGRFGLSG